MYVPSSDVSSKLYSIESEIGNSPLLILPIERSQICKVNMDIYLKFDLIYI